MELNPKVLIQQFRDVTMGFISKNAGDGAVDIVRGIVNGMEKTLKVIDKYLAAGADKAKQLYEKGSVKTASVKAWASEKGSKLAEEFESKGVFQTTKDRATQVTQNASRLFARGDPPGQVSEPDGKVALPAESKSFFDVLSQMTVKLKSISGSLEASQPIQLGGAGTVSTAQSKPDTIVVDEKSEKKTITDLMREVLDRMRGGQSPAEKVESQKTKAREERKKDSEESYALQKNRQDRRAKEIEDEKNGAKTKPKEKGSGGILGAILSAINGVSSVIGFGLKALGGLLPGAFLGALKFLPKILMGAGKLSAGISGITKTVAGGAARGVLGAAVNVGGRVAMGVLGLASAKVVIAASVVYGGYKLYKYLTRNSLGSGTYGLMTRLRMLSYGFNDTNREHYNKLLELDMLMKDYVSGKDGRAVYKKFDKEFKDKVLDIFEIGRNEPEKYAILNSWFIKRYTPAHAAFMHAYYGSGGADYLGDLEKLSNDQCFNFATSYSLPSEVHDFKKIPVFDNPETVVSKAEVDVLLSQLRQAAKKDSKQLKGANPEDVQQENLKKAKQDAAAHAAEAAKLTQTSKQPIAGAAADPAIKDPQKPNAAPTQRGIDLGKVNLQTASTSAAAPVSPDAEPKPQVTASSSADESKPLQTTIGKVAAAPGPLTPGNQNLEGIRSNVPKEKIYNLDPNVLKLLTGMAKEYYDQTGKNITVTEAFRTRADQEALKAKYGDRAAAPGSSLHEYGLAVDISSTDADALDKMGLMRKYGFTRPVGGETWHIEPAGVATQPQKAKTDPALRSQLIESSPGRGGGGLGITKTPPNGLMYRRDVALQKKLFDGGTALENTVAAEKNSATPESIPKPTVVGSAPNTLKASDGTSVTSGDGKAVVVAGAPGPLTDMLNKVAKKPSSSSSTSEEAMTPNPQTGANKALYAQPDKVAKATLPDAENKPKISQITTPPPVSPTAPKGLDPVAGDKNLTQANLNPGEFAKLEPRQAVVQASKMVGMDPNTMLAFAQVESSLNPAGKNPNSSAKGLFQITKDTWKDLLSRYGEKYNIPANADIHNPYYNSLLGVSYAKENMAKLKGHKELGVRDDTALYLAHHYGPSGANRILRNLKANPESGMDVAVSADSYQSNTQELRGKTVAQYVEYLNKKLSKAGSTAGASGGSVESPVSTPSKPPVNVAAGQPQTPAATKPAPSSASPASEAAAPRVAVAKPPSIMGTSPEVVSPLTGKTPAPMEEFLDGPEVVTPASNADPYAAGPVEVRQGVVMPPPQPRPGFVDMSKPQGGDVRIAESIFGERKQPALPPPQPSAALSLVKTETILSGMGDTLVQIRNILQGIRDKPTAMGGGSAPGESSRVSEGAASAPSPAQPQQPIKAPVNLSPSYTSVSMSRRSLLG